MRKYLLLLLASIMFTGMAFADEGDSPQNVKVIDSLEGYTGTEAFIFNKEDSKFYAFNDQGFYEEWGVFSKVNTLKLKGTDGEAGYIASSDRATYIDTGYTPAANTRIVAEIIAPTIYYGDFETVFGTHNQDWSNNMFTCAVQGPYGSGDFRLGNQYYYLNVDGNKRPSSYFPGRRTIIEMDGATGIIRTYAEDGTSVLEEIEGSPLTEETKPTQVLTVFAGIHGDAVADYGREIKLFSMKIYEGETLVRDYVPYVKEGMPGLYDKQTSTFLLPTGEGLYAGSTTAYEGKIVRYDKNSHAYKFDGGEWKDLGAMTLQEITDTNYKDMNNWETNDDHKEIFSDGKIEFENGVNDIPSYVGTGNFEPLLYKVEGLEEGAEYNFSFKYTNYSATQVFSWTRSARFRAAVWSKYDLSTSDNCAWGMPNAPLSFYTAEDAPISLDFTPIPDQDWMSLILQFGNLEDGQEYSFKFADLKVAKYVYPETYPTIAMTAAIDALIEKAKAVEKDETTVVLYNALQEAIAAAEKDKANADLLVQKAAFDALKEAINTTLAVNEGNLIDYIRETIDIAKKEGKLAADNAQIADCQDFLQNGTEKAQGDKCIAALRIARALAALERDNHEYAGHEPAEGSFYLYNVGQKAYLTIGGDWSTHAILGYPGQEATLTAKDDGYTIQFFDITTNSNYLFPVYQDGRQKTFLDGPESGASTCIFEDAGDGSYYIRIDDRYLCFDGSLSEKRNYTVVNRLTERNGDNAKWKLVTKEDRLAPMEEATVSNPVDITCIMKNPNFDRYGNIDEAWPGLNQSFLAAKGITYGDFNTEIWWENAPDYYEIYQTVPVPKAGIYEIKCQAYYRHGDTNFHLASLNGGTLPEEDYAVLEADAVEVPLKFIHEAAGKCPGDIEDGVVDTELGAMTDTPRGDYIFFETGYYWNSAIVTVEEDNHELYLGIFKDSNWAWPEGSRVDIDNFRIVYLGAEGQGISQLTSDTQKSKALYNLQGQRVNDSYKGVVIVNGKKVVK